MSRHVHTVDGLAELCACVWPVQVDCTKEQQLCKDHFVTAFPSIRVFRQAHDDVVLNVSYAAGHTGQRVRVVTKGLTREKGDQ
jgi:hypothetical protein